MLHSAVQANQDEWVNPRAAILTSVLCPPGTQRHAHQGQECGQERVMLVYQGQTDCLLKWKDWLYGLGESGWCDALWQELHCRHSFGRRGRYGSKPLPSTLGAGKMQNIPVIVNDAISSFSNGVLSHCPKTALSNLSHSSHPDTLQSTSERASIAPTQTGCPTKCSVALNVALETEKKLDRLYEVIINWTNFSKFTPTFSWAMSGNKISISHLLPPHSSDLLFMFCIHWMLLYLSM